MYCLENLVSRLLLLTTPAAWRVRETRSTQRSNVGHARRNQLWPAARQISNEKQLLSRKISERKFMETFIEISKISESGEKENSILSRALLKQLWAFTTSWLTGLCGCVQLVWGLQTTTQADGLKSTPSSHYNTYTCADVRPLCSSLATSKQKSFAPRIVAPLSVGWRVIPRIVVGKHRERPPYSV